MNGMPIENVGKQAIIDRSQWVEVYCYRCGRLIDKRKKENIFCLTIVINLNCNLKSAYPKNPESYHVIDL